MDPTTNPTPTPTPAPAPAAPVPPVPPVAAPGATPGAAPVFNQMSASEAFAAPVPGGAQPLVGATDPITMPAPPKAPDPVEEELKAPFKAAEPVPGSIGSAISVPEGAAPAGEPGRTPSVSFTDPALNDTPNNTSAPVAPKKNNKTLIALVAVAGLIVVVLAVVLGMQLLGGDGK